MVHAYNPITPEVEAGGSLQVCGQSGLKTICSKSHIVQALFFETMKLLSFPLLFEKGSCLVFLASSLYHVPRWHWVVDSLVSSSQEWDFRSVPLCLAFLQQSFRGHKPWCSKGLWDRWRKKMCLCYYMHAAALGIRGQIISHFSPTLWDLEIELRSSG